MTIPKYTLEDVRAEYNRLDDLCMVDTSAIELRVSKRATQRYGYCHYRAGHDKRHLVPDYISITDFVFECEEQFWDTIRHEYAHALVTLRDGKCHHHDSVWKAACLEVGCSPERVATEREAGIRSSLKRKKKAKYIVSCMKCGRKWSYLRAGSIVKALKSKRVCTCPCGSHGLTLKEI